MPMTIELQSSETQTTFNLKRWHEVLNDPDLARLPHRIETDRHGHIIMTPPPAPFHGQKQFRVGSLLERLLPHGIVLTECPLSTSDGVKAVDVAWLEPVRRTEIRSSVCLTRAPEICVEVVSPSNTTAELLEKKALYFEAGAREVWICNQDGTIDFYCHRNSNTQQQSEICPDFPAKIDL
jgi:Uma2 family endonuclease